MKLKNIFNKIFKPKPKKVESDNSYCYSKIIWNEKENLIILISFTEDYFEQIIEIQDAMNCSWQNLVGKIVYSSYEEETDKKDEDGNNIVVIHKKYYLLIGGAPLAWQDLFMNISNLSNDILSKISNEIINNCNPEDFMHLVDDGILYGFSHEYCYDSPKEIIAKAGDIHHLCTDPEVLLSRLPNGFTGRDLLKFIKIINIGREITMNGDLIFNVSKMDNNGFKDYYLYPLYCALFKDPTVKKLKILLEPLYKQPDDDSIPGDVSDESLDEIFREQYERFSAVVDEDILYEDIDEEVTDDEE